MKFFVGRAGIVLAAFVTVAVAMAGLALAASVVWKAVPPDLAIRVYFLTTLMYCTPALLVGTPMYCAGKSWQGHVCFRARHRRCARLSLAARWAGAGVHGRAQRGYGAGGSPWPPPLAEP